MGTAYGRPGATGHTRNSSRLQELDMFLSSLTITAIALALPAP